MAKGKNQGWVRIYRSIWDTPFWKSAEAFDKRSAFIDLVLLANHDHKEFLSRTGVVNVGKGQLFTSTKSLSQRWHWSENKVRRYLKVLSALDMVYIDSNTNGTLLTLINYEKFQF